MCISDRNTGCGKSTSLRKQPSFFAPGPRPSGVSRERETPLGPGAKNDGFFRRLEKYQGIENTRLIA